jgi:hypothetical protein
MIMIKWITRKFNDWLAKKDKDVPKYLGRK